MGVQTLKIAILDDYHGVTADAAPWAKLGTDVQVKVFREYLPAGRERTEALLPFDVIICMRERTPFPAEQIAALPNLRLLVTTGLRNNSIDLPACAARGVVVSGAAGDALATAATAELAWAHILGLYKNLPYEDASMRAGNWQTRMPRVLAGTRLGVLGLGKLGVALSRVGRAFDMEVVAWSPNLTDERAAEHNVQRVDKQTLFATSDVISVHLILSERSRGVVDAASIAAMKADAFLVNTSRAGLVDNAALLKALSEHRIGGAGLDVYPDEPLPANDPVRKLDNVVLTPHLGYVSQNNFKVFYDNAWKAIDAWAKGAPINLLK
jgi:phosphoglycerate dehydrogenase-like enzyme